MEREYRGGGNYQDAAMSGTVRHRSPRMPLNVTMPIVLILLVALAFVGLGTAYVVWSTQADQTVVGGAWLLTVLVIGLAFGSVAAGLWRRSSVAYGLALVGSAVMAVFGVVAALTQQGLACIGLLIPAWIIWCLAQRNARDWCHIGEPLSNKGART